VANLTITIDDTLLQRARVRAVEQGTSVNAILRAELIRFAGDRSGVGPAAEFLALARGRAGSSGPSGRTWTRDELHMDRFAESDDVGA
jgi:hypothetical protein